MWWEDLWYTRLARNSPGQLIADPGTAQVRNVDAGVPHNPTAVATTTTIALTLASHQQRALRPCAKYREACPASRGTEVRCTSEYVLTTLQQEGRRVQRLRKRHITCRLRDS